MCIRDSCEVVCYTADHNAAFHELTPSRIDLVLEALIDRTRELGAREDVEQVFCFENRGQEIGVTQPHPHGQIYAYPFITPVTERVLSTVAAYRQNCGRNLFDDVLDAERADGSRTVLATDHWTAFVPDVYKRQIWTVGLAQLAVRVYRRDTARV